MSQGNSQSLLAWQGSGPSLAKETSFRMGFNTECQNVKVKVTNYIRSGMVTMLMRAFCAVSDRRSVTPLSRNRLPSMSIPIRGAVSGMSRMTKMVTADRKSVV